MAFSFLRIDGGFDVNLFLEDMEEYMIPAVITAFLTPTMSILKEVRRAHANAMNGITFLYNDC